MGMKKLFVIVGVCVALIAVLAGWRGYLVHTLRAPVLAQLNDPDSAQFRNLKYVGNWTVKGGLLCGQVNAKNAMGGYVGYSWFESGIKSASIEDVEIKSVFDKSGLDRCDYGESLKWWWLRF
jgi:hypothetical protein